MLAPGMQPGLASPGRGQSQGGQASWLGSAVRSQGWREDGPRGQGLSVSPEACGFRTTPGQNATPPPALL